MDVWTDRHMEVRKDSPVFYRTSSPLELLPKKLMHHFEKTICAKFVSFLDKRKLSLEVTKLFSCNKTNYCPIHWTHAICTGVLFLYSS